MVGETGNSVVMGIIKHEWFNPPGGEWVDNGLQTLPSGDKIFSKPEGVKDEAVLYLASEGAGG